MMMELEHAVTVYAVLGEGGRICSVETERTMPGTAGRVEIDRSDSGSRTGWDSYGLAQIHYFPEGTENPDGTHRYIFDPSRSPAYREAAPEELEQERAEIEAAGAPPEPSAESSIHQALTDLELERIEQGQAITDLELSDIENGQKVTDLEIKVLELTENVQQYQSAL